MVLCNPLIFNQTINFLYFFLFKQLFQHFGYVHPDVFFIPFFVWRLLSLQMFVLYSDLYNDLQRYNSGQLSPTLYCHTLSHQCLDSQSRSLFDSEQHAAAVVVP